MRRYLALSVVASTLLMAGGDIAPVEPVVEAVEEESAGKVSGQFRAFYVDRTYDGTTENNRNALAVGGWIGYDSAEWNGLSAGAKFYVTEGLRIHDESETDVGTASYDPSLQGRNFEDYGFIGEAYLNYKFGNTNIKVGRQRLDTPLAGSDDARMLPNLFEAAVVSNTDIEDTTLILAHVTRETVGTFGNIYGGGALGLVSGYGLGMNAALSGEFVNMGQVAIGENTDGVTAGAVIYKGIEGLTLTAWDYYAHDILNAVYLQADYGWNCRLNDSVKMKASAQYIGQSDVGDSLAGDVDSNYWGIKLGASSGALSGYVAYSQTGDTDGGLDGAIITPWGGMPAFTQGMVTRHQFLADTDSWKVAGTYKMNELLDMDVKASVFYAEFDVGTNDIYASDTKTKEAGFDIQYQATKDLNLRFRGNFPTDFNDGLDWNEYRLIANYNF